MPTETGNFIFLSELLNLPLRNADTNQRMGTLTDLAASTSAVYPKITGLMVQARGRREQLYIPWNAVIRAEFKKGIVVEGFSENAKPGASPNENEILLRKSFLDKQLISTNGHKLVRVNDLHLLIEESPKARPNLWLVHIDVGARGLLRRLGWERAVNGVFRWIVSRDIRDKLISWKYVQPTTATNVYGSLNLKTDSSKLSELHPADLADILEDMGTDERISVIEAIDDATAATTLQEMTMKIRVQVAEALDTPKLAAIIHEMQMDEVVDLIDELSPERRTALFQALPAEKVAEIKELARLPAHRVGSVMNTAFVTARVNETVRDVLLRIGTECERAELIYYIYVLNGDGRLKGVASLRHLLSSDSQMLMADLMAEHPVSVSIDSKLSRVARLFFKYKFAAIPVVDEEDRMEGIVSLQDTLEDVFPEAREES